MNREEMRQALLAVQDHKIEPVSTPEWGPLDGSIFVRTLSLPERSSYLSLIRSDVLKPEVQGQPNGKAAETARDLAGIKLAIVAMCDSESQPFMLMDDLEILAEKSWAALNRVIDAAAKLNGLTKAALDSAKNVLPGAVTSVSSTVSH